MSVAAVTALAFGASALALGFDTIFGLDPTIPDVALLGLVSAAGLDIGANKGQVAKLATAGADRLLGADPQRDAECQATASAEIKFQS